LARAQQLRGAGDAGRVAGQQFRQTRPVQMKSGFSQPGLP
jgi:hypothetical protein